MSGHGLITPRISSARRLYCLKARSFRYLLLPRQFPWCLLTMFTSLEFVQKRLKSSSDFLPVRSRTSVYIYLFRKFCSAVLKKLYRWYSVRRGVDAKLNNTIYIDFWEHNSNSNNSKHYPTHLTTFGSFFWKPVSSVLDCLTVAIYVVCWHGYLEI